MEELVTKIIEELRHADENRTETLKNELIRLIGADRGAWVRSLIEDKMRKEVLEVRWELEEVLEATEPPAKTRPRKGNPPPRQAPEPEPAAQREDGGLVTVYDDPRGILLHRTSDGQRWFLTQPDPNTGQPQTLQLNQQQVASVKQQLAGSPYWVLGEH